MIDSMPRATPFLGARARGRALVASERRLFLLVMGLALIAWAALTLAIGPTAHAIAEAADPQVRQHDFVACENAVQRRAAAPPRCHGMPPMAERLHEI